MSIDDEKVPPELVEWGKEQGLICRECGYGVRLCKCKFHDARVTDWCYGITGGVRVDCSCGYWVLPSGTTEEQARGNIYSHQAKKRREALDE